MAFPAVDNNSYRLGSPVYAHKGDSIIDDKLSF